MRLFSCHCIYFEDIPSHTSLSHPFFPFLSLAIRPLNSVDSSCLLNVISIYMEGVLT